MPNDELRTPSSNSQLYYEIAQSASDPNRPWQLVEKDASGEEYSRTGFRTYGDAWHAAERRKSDEIGCQAKLLIRAAQQQAFRPNEYKADILTWSERQASLLRRIAAGEKIIDQIDWENVIEEVDFAGRRQLTEVRSLLVQALASMLKAWAWPGSTRGSPLANRSAGLSERGYGSPYPEHAAADQYQRFLFQSDKTVA